MLLFIKGMYRSGTTTFSKILSNHPELSIKNDVLFPLFKNIKEKVEMNKNKKKTKYISDYFLNDLDIYSRIKNFDLKENIYNKKGLKKDLKIYVNNYAPELKKKINKINFSNYYKFLNSFFKVVQLEKPNTKIIGAKEVWTNEFYFPIKRYFPTSKFLFIVRSPMGVISSSFKDKNSNYEIYFLIKQWRKLAYLSYFYQGKNAMIIKYENLIKNNKQVFKRIENFLNLEKNGFSTAIFLTKKSKWKQNSSFKTSSKNFFNNSSLNNWKKFLNDKQKLLIFLLCFPEMKLLGYDCKYKNSLNVLKRIKENKRMISKEIGNKNFENELKRYNSLINKKYEKNFYLNKKHYLFLFQNL